MKFGTRIAYIRENKLQVTQHKLAELVNQMGHSNPITRHDVAKLEAGNIKAISPQITDVIIQALVSAWKKKDDAIDYENEILKLRRLATLAVSDVPESQNATIEIARKITDIREDIIQITQKELAERSSFFNNHISPAVTWKDIHELENARGYHGMLLDRVLAVFIELKVITPEEAINIQNPHEYSQQDLNDIATIHVTEAEFKDIENYFGKDCTRSKWPGTGPRNEAEVNFLKLINPHIKIIHEDGEIENKGPLYSGVIASKMNMTPQQYSYIQNKQDSAVSRLDSLWTYLQSLPEVLQPQISKEDFADIVIQNNFGVTKRHK